MKNKKAIAKIGSLLLFLSIFGSVLLFSLPEVNNIREQILGDEIVDDSDHFLEGLKSSELEFGLTEVVSTESTSSSSDPTIAVDGVGNVHVAWSDYTDYDNSGGDADIFYKRWDAVSGTWTPTEVVSTESTYQSFFPTIAVDGAGNVHVAWVDSTNYANSGGDTDIFYKRWDVVSSTWTTTEVVSTESTLSSGPPMIAVGGIGNVHVAWYEYKNYLSIFYKRWDAVSSTWTPTEVVSTESTSTSSSPKIAVNGAGNAHVAWYDSTNYDNSGTDVDIFYKQWDVVSSTWTTTEVVSTESILDSISPTIAVDGAGNVHVAWVDSTNYANSGPALDIFYKRRDTVSSTWTTTEVVSTESILDSMSPTIVVDGAGNVHVMWYDSTNYANSGPDLDIIYKRRHAVSGTWTTAEVVSTESTSSSSSPTIVVDGAGNVHVAWVDYTDYDNSGGDADIFYKRLSVPEISTNPFTVIEVTNTPNTMETTPMLGADDVSRIVVYTSQTFDPINGVWEPGVIYAQRLDGSNAIPPLMQVGPGGTDNQLNDISGNLVVYTAFTDINTLQGQIQLIDLNNGHTPYVLSDQAMVREARIHGDIVVWIEYYLGIPRVMLKNISAGAAPMLISTEDTQPARSLQIGDTFVVWETDYDIVAYDLRTSQHIWVADSPIRERYPSTSGTWITWEEQTIPSVSRICAVDIDSGDTPIVVIDDGGINHGPTIDGDIIAYEALVNYGLNDLNYDIFVYRISTGETLAVTTGVGDQKLNCVFGNQVAYVDNGAHTNDISVTTFWFDPSNLSPELLWIRQFGTDGTDEAWVTSVDSTGVYVAGHTNGILPDQTSAGYEDNFVRKYDHNGNEIWTQQFGTQYSDYILGSSIDSTGLYVTGSLGSYGFVRKYDPYDGSEIWTKQFMLGTFEISVDSSGVYVVGSNFSGGNEDVFIRKYNHDGIEVWTHEFGTPTDNQDRGRAISVESTGVYIVGFTEGTLPGQTNAGGVDSFVRKYNLDTGSEIWTQQFGTTDYDKPIGVSTDSTGVYIVGYTEGTLPGQTSAGDVDAYIRKYDHNGNEVWTHQFGTLQYDRLSEISIYSNEIYVAGQTYGALPGQTSAGGVDSFVRKYDPYGNEIWTYQFGSTETEEAYGVAVDSTGIYVSGYTNGTLSGQTSSGGRDAFVVKLVSKNTPTGVGIKVIPSPEVSLTFSEVTGVGYTYLTSSTENPGSEMPGFQFLDVYYDITTTATYAGTVTVSIAYDDTGMTLEEEEALQFLHWNGTTWVDETKNIDTTNNIIYGSVSSFSWFGIAHPINLPIFIDGEATGVGAHNWTWALNSNICTGSGTMVDPYIIKDFNIDGWSSGSCIEIINSDVYFKIENCTLYNSTVGIKLYNVENGAIYNNSIYDNTLQGIYHSYSRKNTIAENYIHSNGDRGIYITGPTNALSSHENNITNNTIYNNVYGIYLYPQANDNTISSNEIFQNVNDGIYVASMSSRNTISDNNIYTNTRYGVQLGAACSDNSILVNSIHDNINAGILLWLSATDNTISNNNISTSNNGIMISTAGTINNIISNNTISNNYQHGIFLYSSNSNDILNNNIFYNAQNGICINSDASNNEIRLNNFTGNGINAIDNGTNNQWDNGALGNYWDDYTGMDLNDNGIGDSPYLISGSAGSQDNYPIWDDGPDDFDSDGLSDFDEINTYGTDPLNPDTDGDGLTDGDEILNLYSDPLNYMDPFNLPIIIDGDATGVGAHNWTWALNSKVCTGSGTFPNPYVIEGFEIDAGESGTGIIIRDSDAYFVIKNCTFINSDMGIFLFNVVNGKIIDNNCSNNYYGIYFANCDNNTVSGNSANDNYYGFYIYSNCDNNTVTGNTANNNYYYGIFLNTGCTYNIIGGNTVNDNDSGISLNNYCENNTISGNTANNNYDYGIYLDPCNDNTILENIFIGNGVNAWDDGTNNQWDDGSLGNYWDDYSGVDLDDNGIGDTPYLISGLALSQDNYPIWDDGIDLDSDGDGLPDAVEEILGTNPFDLDTDDDGLTDGNEVNIGSDPLNYMDPFNLPIIIDGDATGVGAHNWTWALNSNVCTGSGKYSDPYVIEGFEIDAGGLGSGIEIRNSEVYFIIKNCKTYNASSENHDAGIKLENVSNGVLINNNASNNERCGIYLNDSSNNTISGNTANNNFGDTYLGYGIWFNSNCYNNTVSGNFLINNTRHGIYLMYGGNNTISGNVVYNNENGIGLWYSSNNIISGNIVNNSDWLGIYILYGGNNTILENTVNNSTRNGITLLTSSNNTISENVVINNKMSGIRLNSDCENNDIIGNIANYNDNGIYLENYCNDNIITGNTANYNFNYGIYLNSSCNNNTLTGNTANNNLRSGIYLFSYCNDNDIIGNTADNNGHPGGGHGIYLEEYCNFNTISGNNVNNNNDNGIYLDYSSNNTISDNTASDNYNYGIYLYDNCNGNLITGNTASNMGTSNQDWGIYVENYSNDNFITGNTANNNQYYGIYLYSYCNDNTITGNNASNNNWGGICLHNYCDFNNVSGNTASNIGTSNQGVGIFLYNYCNDNFINGNNASNNRGNGIKLWDHCNNTTIRGNTVIDSDYGILLNSNCDNNSITGNTITDSVISGIFLGSYCNDNAIRGNTVINSYHGISLGSYCNDNAIRGNTVIDNECGIIFTHCDNNSITGNTVKKNYNGISLSSTTILNHFSNNTLINNTVNAWDEGVNQWDNGILGNYWGDYVGHDLNNDGIGDDPYIVPPGVTGTLDNFPIWDDGLDIDSDGLLDDEELILNTDPLLPDTDFDGLIDGDEVDIGTNPLDIDTDADGLTDGDEVLNLYSDPLNYMDPVNLPIFIDGDATGVGAHNWTWALNYKVCTGSGDYSDPYVIEGFEIDAGGLGSGIAIRNSDVYFIIKNCKVYNASSENHDAGIKLEHVNNGLLINNIASNNERCGIYLNDGSNNTISGNTANNNFGDTYLGYGIWFFSNCYNNIISGNNLINNTRYGIYLMYGGNNIISGNMLYTNNIGIGLWQSSNNTISGNIVNNSAWCGIYIMDSCNNTISENIANNTTKNGIYLWTGSNNVILGNTVNNNLQNGIYLWTSNNNTILGNSVNNNNDNGIYLDYSNNNTVFDNLAQYNKIGICLNYSDSNTVSDNTASDNYNYGIYLENYCNDNSITGNTANENSRGIYLHSYCNDNSITGNTANNNDGYGIYLRSTCNDNTITGNTANENSRGIYLHSYCNDNTITGNTANNNFNYGIYLVSSCNYNTITGNTANENANGIYLIYSCNGNDIIGNTANNNDDYGIYLHSYCNDNTITGNTASNIGTSNQDNGIYLYTYCSDNDISGNTVNNNFNYGIYLVSSCNYNTITGNTANQNLIGIYLYTSCSDNDILGNTVNNNFNYGIYLVSYCNYNTITGNTANENANGIYLIYSCNDNDISGNTANYNDFGIYLYTSCSDNDISGNTANNNRLGIRIGYFCDFNNITGNFANNNELYGIYLVSSCNYNTITGNTANENGDGIYLIYSCNGNDIIGNTANENELRGIFLNSYCAFNTISGNTANNNNLGIQINYFCYYNTITGNTANENLIGIYLDSACDVNTISGNTVNYNNYYGIYLFECDDNTILDNIAHDNDFGIYLYYSHDNVISLNDLSNYIENIHEEGCWNVFQENLIQGAQIGINFYNSTGNEIDSNTFINNGIGIMIRNSTDNSVICNIFENNTDYAIMVEENSSNNEIYYNEFIDNSNGGVQAYDDSGGNSWTDDQGIGNYWNDFLQRYPDSERDDTMWTGEYELDGQIGVTDGGSQVFSPSGIDKFLTTINDLIDYIQNLPDDCWENAEIKNAMIDKLLEIKVDVSLGNLEEAYDKLLHDIKPKLTALKTDETGELWGNGIFNKPWIVIEAMFEMFSLVCNDLLSQIQTLITDI